MEERNTYRFLNRQEIEEIIGAQIPVMSYNAIVDAIPKEWKRILKMADLEETEDTEEGNYKRIDQIVDADRPVNKIYQELIAEKCIEPADILEKWRLEINSMEQGLKLLLRNIPYGTRLHNMGIIDTPNCINCGQIETIQHLYWDGQTTANLWRHLKDVAETNTRRLFILEREKCLLGSGTWILRKDNNTEDHLSILVKYYIHATKCSGETRNNYGLDRYIRSQLVIEENISRENRKTNMFREKWDGWLKWMEGQQ